MSENIGMTDAEIQELEAIREAALEAELQPYKEFSEKCKMSFDANVKVGNITKEEISQRIAIPDEKITPDIRVGGKTL